MMENSMTETYEPPATSSAEMNELAGALSKAQSKIKGAAKDVENKFFKSSYADLSSVWDACRDALTSNELAILQTMEPAPYGGAVMNLRTTLVHSSGQWIASLYPVIPQKDDPQGWGSALTYARRYSLAAMVGVAPAGDDDDGEAAMQRNGATDPKEDYWGGPLKKTAFKEAMRDFDQDLNSCTDYDQLVAFLKSPLSVALMDQCQRDLPSWWSGQAGSDVKGIESRIEVRKAELAQQETE